MKDRLDSRRVAFWLLAAELAFFLFAASAPSPLYPVYAAAWHFSSITLTTIYAIYAFASLTALLVTGRLSDHIGRRRVVIAALVVQIAGMVVFILADGVGGLYLGRILQGFGTGAATAAISAWLLDLQPPDKPRFGGLVGGTAVVGGLAAGALGSGLLVQYGPDPTHLVFWMLLVVNVVALATMPLVPDPVLRAPGWLASMRPEIGVPPSARSLFAASAPSLIAIWAVGGLYLSLGPSLAISLLQSDSQIAGGLVIVALLGTAAVASVLARAADPGRSVITGSIILIVGVAITLLAVAAGSVAGLYAGSVIAGIGFGPAFSGVMRSLTPLAPPDKRGALLASIYVVLYLSFSVPAVIAGFGVSQFGLRVTTYAFGLVVMALAAFTTVAISRRNRALTDPARPPGAKP
jgi:MFS family permease